MTWWQIKYYGILELLHIFTHMHVPDISTHTHTHTDSISHSCPSRNSPIGPCHLKKNEEDREVWKCCLDPAIMPTVKSFVCVCVCVWITFCLPACLLAQIVRRLVYLRARVHAFWQYPRLPRKCLSGDHPHAATLLREVSECCFLQTKWWHPVCDSDCPHRITPDTERTAPALVTQNWALEWAQE